MSKELTTTNISKSHQRVLKQLSKKVELSQVDFLNGAVEYFKKTGINPFDEITSPKEEMAVLNKRLDQVIRFIRVHERDKLSPLLDSLIIIDRRLKDKLEYILTKEDLINVHKKIENVSTNLNKDISEINEKLSKVNTSISTANKNFVSGYHNHNSNIQNIVTLIKFLFYLLINKRMGSYNKEDIQNFKNAIPKV